jgi:hypothetical protein
MRYLLLAFALYAAFHAGRAYGNEPRQGDEPTWDLYAMACAPESRDQHEAQCRAYPAPLDFGGMTQCELAGLWTSGDPFIGFDDEVGCFYLD